MKERPILFSGPMVRAILAGHKTQTRRIVKDDHFIMKNGIPDAFVRVHCSASCPYGAPGDRLWVREAWRIVGAGADDSPLLFDRDSIQYRADDDQSYIDRYRSPIFMPRRFSRITLEVTAVRVERVQEISEDDAKAEGVTPQWEPGCSGRLMEWALGFSYRPAASAFSSLWESINGPGSWAANPWVWVIEFRRVW